MGPGSGSVSLLTTSASPWAPSLHQLQMFPQGGHPAGPPVHLPYLQPSHRGSISTVHTRRSPGHAHSASSQPTTVPPACTILGPPASACFPSSQPTRVAMVCSAQGPPAHTCYGSSQTAKAARHRYFIPKGHFYTKPLPSRLGKSHFT